MQSVGVAWGRLQNLAVQPIGFIQLAGLMMAQGCGEHCLNAGRCRFVHGLFLVSAPSLDGTVYLTR
jgi:hypothetical protein